jgi:hypothetical protein
MAIVAILAIGGSLVMGNKQSGAVRSLLDELEGAISNAHQAAAATGCDIALVSWGAWDKDGPLRIAYGDAALVQDDESSDSIKEIGEDILKGIMPSNDESEGASQAKQTVAVPFIYSPTDAVQRRACIVVKGEESKWDDVAMGDKEPLQNLGLALPLDKILRPANNFCQGGGSDISVYISGRTKRFSKSAFIQIVGTSTNGAPIANGPVGLIVLLENSATVFKFYNPGGEDGGGKWRRL